LIYAPSSPEPFVFEKEQHSIASYAHVNKFTQTKDKVRKPVVNCHSNIPALC
jgi:hypothetical protein